MKIIRVRRGFSTNCSGANEYFPPNPVLPPPSTDAGLSDWTLAPDARVVFRWVTLMPDGSLPPMLKDALESSDGGADPSALGSNDAGPDETAASGNTASGDRSDVPQGPFRGASGVGLILFLVMFSVLTLFALERLVRGLSRKLKRRSHDDSEG